jgi:tetratricopeptide (TPR) repeat protein
MNSTPSPRADVKLAVFYFLFLLLTIVSSAQESPPMANLPTVRDAAAALSVGDLGQAETDLQTILRKTPADTHALNLLGIVRVQQKREADAEPLFQQAIALQPNYAGAHASLGLLYAQMGKDDLAVPSLKEALRLDPGRKDAQSALLGIWRDQAHDAVQNGDPEKALALLIEARKLNPSDPGLKADVQYDLGMVALRMSLFPDAIDAFDAVLKVKPDNVSALYALGRAKMSIAKFDDAQQIFEHYIQIRPNDASGYYALGITLQALQRASDARAEYGKSIAVQPQQTESYFQLGLMDLDAGDLASAGEKFERILERSPQHAGALAGLGRMKFQEKQYAEAASLLEKAVASNPNSREAHYYLGLTDARLGNKEESDKELQIASRIEHDEVEKHQNMLKILDTDQIDLNAAKPNQ